MENVPSVVSVADDAEHVSLTPDELAFAMSADDSGLNYAYIIHLPVNAMHVHEHVLAGNVPEQDAYTVETKHTPSIFQDDVQAEIAAGVGATILLPSVSVNSCDTIAEMVSSIATIPAGSTPGISDNSSANEPRPIEIQYLENGIFLHDGQKCEIENLNVENPEISTIESDVKLQLDESVSDHATDYGTFNELHDQENILSELETIEQKEESLPSDIQNVSSSTTDTKKLEKPETDEPELIVGGRTVEKMEDVVSSPKKPVRTYGKSKPNTLSVSTTSLKDASNATVSPSEMRAIQFDKIAREAQPIVQKTESCEVIGFSTVKVLQSQPITLFSRPRKRRLIIDAQKQIPIPEFKRQLLNTKDIVHERIEIAPGTRKAMKCLESGGVAQFFSKPGRPIVNTRLCRLFNNHLVMMADTDNGTTEFANVEPLNADLRIPNSRENEASDLNGVRGNRTLTTQPTKRLINVGKQQVCYFKGLRKPTVFKEYKRIQHDLSPNGTRKVIQYKRKSANKVPDFISASVKSFHSSSNPQHATVKVEEVVYTVEDGESVVLKSHAIIDDTDDDVQNCDDAHNDFLLNTSDNEEVATDEIKTENHCSDTGLVGSDSVDISEVKVDTMQFPTCSDDDGNFCNDNNANFEVQNADNKLSVDLQIDDDLNKLWNYEISSS